MKTFMIVATAGLLAAGIANAMAHAAVMEQLDADADGMVTMEEIAAVLPDFSEDDFAAADTNGDGSLDLEEVGVAVTNGSIAL